jgi:DNA-directed RNA polymerase subunit RPC12/RpoP
MPVTYVCSTCGSDDGSRDAWAEWSIQEQRWVLRTEFDYVHCHRCDTETRLVKVQLNPPQKVVLQL